MTTSPIPSSPLNVVIQAPLSSGSGLGSLKDAPTITSVRSRSSSAERRKKRRSTRRRQKKASKDMLMGLIAQELTQTWQEEASSGILPDEDDIYSVGGLSAADIFYAQINGEELYSDQSLQRTSSGSLPLTSSGSLPLLSDGSITIEDEQEKQDDREKEIISTKIEEAAKEPSSAPTPTNEKLTTPAPFCTPVKTTKTRLQDSLFSPSMHSVSTTSSSSSSGLNSLTIDEIVDHVKSNMPEEIKRQIPQDAWSLIFGDSQADKTRKPTGFLLEKEEEEDTESSNGDTFAEAKPEDEEEDDADDSNSSAISEITDCTGFIMASKTSRVDTVTPKAVTISQKEDEEEEDLCPTLPTIDSSPKDEPEDNFWGLTTTDLHLWNDLPPSGRGMSIRRASASTKASSTKESTTSSSARRLKFGNVQVRYYERVLDINPAVSSGVAIGIGWNYKKGGTLSVNDWENQRGDTRARRPNEFILHRKYREKMLLNIGYTKQDIAKATRIILKQKQNRKVTVQNLPNQHMEEAVEKAARKVKGLLSLGRKSGLVSKY